MSPQAEEKLCIMDTRGIPLVVWVRCVGVTTAAGVAGTIGANPVGRQSSRPVLYTQSVGYF